MDAGIQDRDDGCARRGHRTRPTSLLARRPCPGLELLVVGREGRRAPEAQTAALERTTSRICAGVAISPRTTVR